MGLLPLGLLICWGGSKLREDLRIVGRAILQEFRENWGRILLTLIALAIVYSVLDDFRDWLRRDKAPQTIVQTSPAPVNIDASGKQTAEPSPIYVYVGAENKETSTGGIVQKPTKDSPDIVIKDNNPTYKINYNGKDFKWESPVKEDYKFENGQFTMTRSSEMNVNVSVPVPAWSIGIGKSVNGAYAVTGDYRIGRTPFNVWGYASDKDQAVGLKFVQYK